MEDKKDLFYQCQIIDYLLEKLGEITIQGWEVEKMYKAIKLLEDYKQGLIEQIDHLNIDSNSILPPDHIDYNSEDTDSK